MEEVCRGNDKEKADLVQVWQETKIKRDQIRGSMQKIRKNFKKRCPPH